MKQSAAQMTYSVVAGHAAMVKDRWGKNSTEYKKVLIKLEEAKEELLLNGTPEEIALAKAEMAQEAAETTKVEEKEATTTKTPGFNCRIAIFFQSDKNGRKCAYYWSGRLGDGRAIRMKLTEAENLVAQGQADLLPCHPLKAATQEPEQVAKEVAKPVLTDETITYTIVSRPTSNGIPFIARVLVPGQEVQEYDPQPSCWWMYTEGDLVNAVNKQFKGAWYLKPEVFDTRVSEQQKVEDVASEMDIPTSEVATIAAIAQQAKEDKQAETKLETVPSQEIVIIDKDIHLQTYLRWNRDRYEVACFEVIFWSDSLEEAQQYYRDFVNKRREVFKQRNAILAQKRSESEAYLARIDAETQTHIADEIARSQVQRQEEIQQMEQRKAKFEITNVGDFEVTIRDDEGYISHVHKQGDGKWKCQRCEHYRCEHVQFVQQSGVQLLPRKPMSVSDDEIFTY